MNFPSQTGVNSMALEKFTPAVNLALLASVQAKLLPSASIYFPKDMLLFISFSQNDWLNSNVRQFFKDFTHASTWTRGAGLPPLSAGDIAWLPAKTDVWGVYVSEGVLPSLRISKFP